MLIKSGTKYLTKSGTTESQASVCHSATLLKHGTQIVTIIELIHNIVYLCLRERERVIERERELLTVDI